MLLVLLSALTNSTTELVKASNDLNKTEIIYPTAADTTTVTASSSNGSNGTNATVTNATIPISSGDNSTARLAKTFSVVETVKTVKDGFDAALRKVFFLSFFSLCLHLPFFTLHLSRYYLPAKLTSSLTLNLCFFSTLLVIFNV